ncbi:sugar ABC transporter ATP-binding protein [Hydrogenophaga sp.]|uniref:sugar ABC transporter ATP-binding protein n=1 Tax=Hydrogenophaga sp. TaxID=1904254 RepID=UPI002FCA0D4F
MTSKQPLVELRGVSKSFGQNAALKGVSLAGWPGSIHAVTGENGAGKSTLMKLLAGVHRPDGGEVVLKGRHVALSTPAKARRAGISTVFQELTILPNLTVAENLCLGRELTLGGLIDLRALRREAVQVLERTGIALDPDRLCGTLTVGEQQLLEIAKGLHSEADVFIFDEPTAPLNRAEVDQLEGLLRALKTQGKLVFYISHRLEEIFRFCDTVSVLKDGVHVATQPIETLTQDSLVALMVGRELAALFPERPADIPDVPALQVDRLAVAPHSPSVSFTLRRGEIVGIAGLEGQGQREIVRALAGEQDRHGGEVRVFTDDGTAVGIPSGSVAGAVQRGIALLPEDRKGEGLYLDLSIEDNIWLGPLRQTPLWRRAPRDPALVRRLAERMGLRTPPAQPVGSLSGGNQQKAMLGRWLAADVRVLLVEQPTRGVDVGAKAEIYGLLRQFTDGGGAILAVSGDLPELIGLCDRILVVRGSAIVADVPAHGATEEQLLGHALRGESPSEATP